MTAELDNVLQKIAELTTAVKENKGTQELKKDELIADLSALIDQKNAAQQPERHGDPVEVPAIDKAVSQYKGKYARELKGIVKDGFYKSGTYHLDAVDLFMAKKILDKANAIVASGTELPGADKLKPTSRDLNEAVKAMTADGSGTGDELVPTGMASSLWNDFFTASQIAADLGSIPMPTDPYTLPLNLGDFTWIKGTQNTAATSTDVTTAAPTLTATEQVAEADWSYSLDEDSIIAFMPALRQRIGASGAEQMDAFCLNADSTATSTGNINLDDSTPASTAYYLTVGQDGIRHQALVDNTTSTGSAVGAAISDAYMVAGIGYLGKYGIDFRNTRIVPDIATYVTMLGMTNIATWDKYGPNATIITGELAKYRGIPILPSASMPLTEADGKCSVTAGNNTKGGLVLYNKTGWQTGFRRGLTIEVDRLIQKRSLVMVVSFRIAIAAYGTRSSAKHTAILYNVTV